MTLNSWLSCLCHLSAGVTGVTGVCYLALFMWWWSLNPCSPHARQAFCISKLFEFWNSDPGLSHYQSSLAYYQESQRECSTLVLGWDPRTSCSNSSVTCKVRAVYPSSQCSLSRLCSREMLLSRPSGSHGDWWRRVKTTFRVDTLKNHIYCF